MSTLHKSQKIALAVYGVAAGVGVIAGATGYSGTAHLTKPLLMALLAAVVWLCDPRPRDRWIVIGGLLLAMAGDIALVSHSATAFLIGIAFSFGTHVAYIAAFVRGGAVDGMRAMPVIPVAYALVLLLALTSLWNGLGGLRMAIAVYGLALATMAATAATFGGWIGFGGGLFLLSDMLIAIGIAYPHAVTGISAWVMLTYVIGQGLIATGWTRVQLEHDTRPVADRMVATAG